VTGVQAAYANWPAVLPDVFSTALANVVLLPLVNFRLCVPLLPLCTYRPKSVTVMPTTGEKRKPTKSEKSLRNESIEVTPVMKAVEVLLVVTVPLADRLAEAETLAATFFAALSEAVTVAELAALAVNGFAVFNVAETVAVL